MKATEIPVVEFAEFDDAMLQERHTLAKKAHKQLGYKLLAQTINPAANLLAALRKLDIKPLSRTGVEQYKVSKEKVFRRHSSVVLELLWLTLFPAAVTPVWWMIKKIYDMPGIAPLWMLISVVPLFIILMATFGCLCSATWGEDPYRTPRKLRHWKRYSIANYEGAIPEFALTKALQIKEECLTVDFYIEQLVTEIDAEDANKLKDEHERAVLRMRDPFLVATTKDETYYIDVWDEKEYECKL